MKKTAGLDVHKDTIFCGIYDGKRQSEVKEFLTTTGSIGSLGLHLQQMEVEEIAMESTGIYWIPVWNILEQMGFKLMLVNPFLIKQMPGRKSDVKDAQWIAALLHKGLLRRSMVPDHQIRELRVYSRRYMKLQQKQVSVLQSVERTLEMSGIRITSLVSNLSSKSIRKIVDQVISGQIDPAELIKEIHGRIINKHGRAKVLEYLTGFVMPYHRLALEQDLEEYDLYNKQAECLMNKMQQICEQHYGKALTLLKTIPGISTISAMIIIAESGADMKLFEDSSKFTGWIGLRPRNDESAGKYKNRSITKGNKHLRTILVQIAWASTRCKDSYMKVKFQRMVLRMPKKKALIAIARKLAVIIYEMLVKQEPYNPNKVHVPQKDKVALQLKYHQKELERLEKLLLNT